RRIARPRALAGHLGELLNLTPEDQTQHEPNSECCEYRPCRIFANVLLRIFLERTSAAPPISPRLFCFAACFAPGLLCLASVCFRKSACGRFQILRCFTSMFFATLQFILRIGRGRRCLFSW